MPDTISSNILLSEGELDFLRFSSTGVCQPDRGGASRILLRISLQVQYEFSISAAAAAAGSRLTLSQTDTLPLSHCHPLLEVARVLESRFRVIRYQN